MDLSVAEKPTFTQRLRDWEPYIYLVLIVLSVASFFVLFGFIVHQQGQIKRAAREASAQARAIQANRIEVIRNNCIGQNVRHDNAIIALYALLRHSGVKPPRLEASAAPIIALINALAPVQDCKVAVKKAQPPHL